MGPGCMYLEKSGSIGYYFSTYYFFLPFLFRAVNYMDSKEMHLIGFLEKRENAATTSHSVLTVSKNIQKHSFIALLLSHILQRILSSNKEQ